MEGHTKIINYITDLIIKKSNNLVNMFDIQVSRNLKESGIVTRSATSNGLWCCVLLPAVLLIYSLQYKVSMLCNLMVCTSIGLLCYSLLFILFISISCLVLKEPTYGGCAASSLIVTLLLYIFLGHDLTFSLLYPLPQIYFYSTLLRKSLLLCPNTFTVGEAMVVVQGVVLFTGMVATKLLFNLGDKVDEEMEFVSKIVFTILSTVGLIVTALYILGEKYRDLRALMYTTGIGCVYGLIVLHASLGRTCIFQIFQYIFMDKNKAQLFTFWLAIAIISALVLMIRTKLAVKANTVTRKTFHVLASLVFMLGIVSDVYLMIFAAGFGLGLLLFLEALRKLEVEPLAKPLQSAFLVYCDDKDMGVFAMTPLYLYVGLSCPLVLVPWHRGAVLERLSGVLATGVGDAAASWFGARYGFNKWSGGQKTFEGTAFNIISQVATVRVLEMFDLLNVSHGLIRTTLAATVTGIVEAKTDQVDNLVLPLVGLLAYQATWFLV